MHGECLVLVDDLVLISDCDCPFCFVFSKARLDLASLRGIFRPGICRLDLQLVYKFRVASNFPKMVGLKFRVFFDLTDQITIKI